jgi:hypothetical protein
MIKLIAFSGGYKGDMLACWLNKEYYATDSSKYSADSSTCITIKNANEDKFRELEANGASLVDIARFEEECFLKLDTDMYIPYHLRWRKFSYYTQPHKFAIFQIKSTPDLIPEIAFNVLIKRLSPPAGEVEIKEWFNTKFSTRVKMLEQQLNHTVADYNATYTRVDYKRVFKDIDPDYIYSIFNRRVDLEFIRMNKQTTLPEIVDTPAGKVSLRDGTLFWHT